MIALLLKMANNKYLNINLNNIQFTVDTFKSINITIDNLEGLEEEKDIKQSLFDLNIAQINTNKQLGGNVSNILDEYNCIFTLTYFKPKTHFEKLNSNYIDEIKHFSENSKNLLPFNIVYEPQVSQNPIVYDFNPIFTDIQTGGAVISTNIKKKLADLFNHSNMIDYTLNKHKKDNMIQNINILEDLHYYYYNAKLNGYYQEKTYENKILDYIGPVELEIAVQNQNQNQLKSNDLRLDFYNSVYIPFLNDKKKENKNYLNYYNKNEKFIDYGDYSILKYLSKSKELKETFGKISEIFANIKITRLVEDDSDNDYYKLNTDKTNIIVQGGNKIKLKNTDIVGYIFLTDIWHKQKLLYQKNTIILANQLIQNNKLIVKNKNKYLKNVILITKESLKQKEDFDKYINSLKEIDFQRILSVTNTNFYKDYMSSLIHYKYKNENENQDDRGSIKKIYDYIQKNLYHNFIKLQERQHIKNLYEYKFNIIIKKENKYIFEDETKPYSTMLLIPSEGQTQIKKTIEYLKDKHKFIDLYYKNKDKYYNYIRIIPEKIIDDIKIEFKIQDNHDFPELNIDNSDSYNSLSKDYEDSSGEKWNILTYNEKEVIKI